MNAKKQTSVLSETKIKELLKKLWLSCHLNFIGFNFTKMQANGFCAAISPAIEELYKDDLEGKKEAYTRHQVFFNDHTIPFAFIVGLVFALEIKYKEAKDKKEEFDVDIINNIKTGLMGPTAGIGDSLFFNGLRIIAAGIAIGLGSTGNVLGPILFILLYGVVQSIVRWYMVQWGYTYGSSFIDDIFSSGLMDSVSKAASILGLMMTGALTAQFVKFPLNWTINFSGAELIVQDVLDNVFPGLLSIVLVFVLVRLLKKGVKPTALILGLLAVAVVFSAIGLF